MKDTPENRVKREIKEWLTVMGFFHFPIRQGLGSYPGLPDIIAVKYGHVLFIEAKARHGTLSDSQRAFRSTIKLVGGHYILARGYEDVEMYWDTLVTP